jgi:hypothetical protein
MGTAWWFSGQGRCSGLVEEQWMFLPKLSFKNSFTHTFLSLSLSLCLFTNTDSNTTRFEIRILADTYFSPVDIFGGQRVVRSDIVSYFFHEPLEAFAVVIFSKFFQFRYIAIR